MRRLALEQCLAALDVLPRMLRFAGDEARVAAHHLPPGVVRRAREPHGVIPAATSAKSASLAVPCSAIVLPSISVDSA